MPKLVNKPTILRYHID